ncbi:MAG: aminotransferase class I/II-fold pyridoxal phosphate-dependent enzyme [Propionibacteriaceae bacterium]|jgi:methionine-gamma-lyase|nr:aminotransferase class I/II-fold pyridoxal phosphate-dependent enzyme [Propionibacteriaceae bacterium]
MGTQEYGFETLAVRAGWWDGDPQTGAVAPPIYLSSNFVFETCDAVNDILTRGPEGAFVYSRGSNPTEVVLEQRLAALEGAEAALAFNTGVSAIIAGVTHLVRSGDHIVAGQTLYAAAQYFFRSILRDRFGVEVTFVDATDPANIAAAIRPTTKVVYVETPANPTIVLTDLAALGRITRDYPGITTIVDNTFASPYLQRPLAYEGIDVVLESATKYLAGHSDVLGGVLAGRRELMDAIRLDTLINLGGPIDAMSAWLVLRGVKTLPARVDRQCAAAQQIAEYLEAHPKVATVYYPGLPSHPQYELARRQMAQPGGMITFDLAGGLAAGKATLDSFRLIRRAVSLGDCDTLAEHPASMTHNDNFVSPADRLASGITDGLVRLSVGLESVDDLLEDLDQALARA